MHKKGIVVFLTLISLFGVVGCGNNKSKDSTTATTLAVGKNFSKNANNICEDYQPLADKYKEELNDVESLSSLKEIIKESLKDSKKFHKELFALKPSVKLQSSFDDLKKITNIRLKLKEDVAQQIYDADYAYQVKDIELPDLTKYNTKILNLIEKLNISSCEDILTEDQEESTTTTTFINYSSTTTTTTTYVSETTTTTTSSIEDEPYYD